MQDEDEPIPPPEGLPERLRDMGRIALGGVGEVRRVWDVELDRPLALKVLQPEGARKTWSRWRFDTEARLTAKLQHPGIVPVFDMGTLPDGRLWYTMQEVQGETFLQILRERDWTLRRKLGVFEQVARIVAYAHDRGTIHRDLKPENVVIGPFGEVIVLDWGVARQADQADPPSEPVGFEPEPFEMRTRDGNVVGTPAYMAPEQASGDVHLHGPHTDVYSLGTMLYEILCGRLPYEGSSVDVWQALFRGPPPDVTTFADPPDELVDLVRRCMEREPEDRLVLSELIERVRSWRDLDQARQNASDQLAAAALLADLPERLRSESAARQLEADAILEALPPHADPEDKHEAWAQEDRSKELLVEAELAEQRWVQTVRNALNHDPENVRAHRLLADHYRERLEEAERQNDALGTARARAKLETHDVGGWHRAWLEGHAVIELITEPPGATATLYRFVEVHRRLEPQKVRELGTTPVEVEVEPGSYQIRLEHPDCDPVDYLAAPGRQERWGLTAPGDEVPTPIRLLPKGTLAEGHCYVPAGWFQAGGDELAVDGLPRRRVWVDGFVVDRSPVTFREYLAFLNEVDDQQLVPTASARQVDPLARRSTGGWELATDVRDHEVALDHPVVEISAEAARRLAAWRTDRDGRSWGLLHDHAWEKAARGVDGRWLPWGQHLEPAWAAVLESFEGPPWYTAAEARPRDVSPYGVLGMAGNVRDWCANGYERSPTLSAVEPVPVPSADALRMIRGGFWGSSSRLARPCCRFAAAPTFAHEGVGIRLGYTVTSGEMHSRTLV